MTADRYRRLSVYISVEVSVMERRGPAGDVEACRKQAASMLSLDPRLLASIIFGGLA